MGIGPGAVADKNTNSRKKKLSGRCWEQFPRRCDTSLVPCVAAEIHVCDSTEDLKAINEGPLLSAYGCSFSPDSDCLLSTVSVMRHSLFHQDGLQQILLSDSVPTAGLVSVWYLEKEDIGKPAAIGSAHGHENCNEEQNQISYDSCSPTLFTYSPKPCCSFSPDGEVITIILNSGQGSLELVSREKEGEGDIMAVATVSRVSLSIHRNRDVHEICLWDATRENKIRSIWRGSCEVMHDGFHGTITNCKFSPDSKVIGVTSNHGDSLFVLVQSGELYAAIDHTNNLHARMSPSDFNFDPTKNNTLAMVWRHDQLKIVKLYQNRFEEIFAYNPSDDHPFYNCVKYSIDGALLAIGTMTGCVMLFDPATGSCNTTLDITSEIIEIDDRIVFDICFSRSCQEIAAAYNDGCVRVWQLPRKLNLQHICRLALMQTTPASRITSLPVPKHLQSYLLYDYVGR
eukprot:Seg2990.3 transcript_id=Seg2990.3/GoldUCD/mRNA.D3Y31 product="WD repeat and SOCS box-containing protein 1" protein_id=Seg2990.3/GoldUCD/D3Y31